MKSFKAGLKILLTLVLAFSIFKVFNVLADNVIFKVTDIEVIDKSEKVVINDVSLNNGSLTNDVMYHSVGDYVEYKLTIKNTSTEDYKLNVLSSNNNSSNLTYTFDNVKNTVVNAGDEIEIRFRITYNQKNNGALLSNQPVNLTLSYGTPNQDFDAVILDIANPKTYDGILTYIILFIVSLICLILLILGRNKLSKILFIVGIVSIISIPFIVKADDNKFEIKFDNNNITRAYTKLASGLEFNKKIVDISDPNNGLEIECSNFKSNIYSDYLDQYTCYLADKSYEDDYYYEITGYYHRHHVDHTISFIKRASKERYEKVKDYLTEDNIISTDESNVPTYAWYTKVIHNEVKGGFDDSNTLVKGAVKGGKESFINEEELSPFDELAENYYCAINEECEEQKSNVIYIYSEAEDFTLNEDSSWMFANLIELSEIDTQYFDTRSVTNMEGMFYKTYLREIDLSSFDTSNVTNMASMFYGNGTTSLSVENFNTKNVTDMSFMFYDANIKTIDVSNFDTSNVTNMRAMFYHYDGEELSLKNFNTKNVTDMSFMFACSVYLTSLDMSNFDTSNVTDMQGMFEALYNIEELDVSMFNTSKVVNMYRMFTSLEKIKTLNLENFDTSNVINMEEMFMGEKSLVSLNISSFDTRKVENMRSMFVNLNSMEELDLSSFDCSNTVYVYKMFGNNPILKKVYISDKWNMVNTEMFAYVDMFIDAPLLIGDYDYKGTYVGNNTGRFTHINDKVN